MSETFRPDAVREYVDRAVVDRSFGPGPPPMDTVAGVLGALDALKLARAHLAAGQDVEAVLGGLAMACFDAGAAGANGTALQALLARLGATCACCDSVHLGGGR